MGREGKEREGKGKAGERREGEGRGRGREKGGYVEGRKEEKDCPPSLYMLKVALFLAECQILHAVTELSTSNAVKLRQ
jgi:hypothetical protein